MAAITSRYCLCGFLACAALAAAQPSLAQRTLGIAATQRAADFRQELGRKLTFVCPATDGRGVNVYGTDVYMDDSAICAAAIHAGALRSNTPGAVSIVMRQGPETFVGTERNGIASRSYGRWDYSFTFAADPEPAAITWRTVWNLVPADFEEPVVVACPPGGDLAAPIWGTDVYVTDSAICVAAVHAGAITTEAGGVVTVARARALAQYTATERRGVTSRQWGASSDAFNVSAASGALAARARLDGATSAGLELAARSPVPATADQSTQIDRSLEPLRSTAGAVLEPAQPRVAEALERIRESPDLAALEARLAAIAARIAVLEQENAELRRFISTSGNGVEIRAAGDVSVEAANELSVRAGANLNIDAAATSRIRSTGTTTIEASGIMKLDGPSVTVNGGGRPVARVGDSAAPGPNGAVVVQQGSATLSSQ